jgi:hypothetical protein
MQNLKIKYYHNIRSGGAEILSQNSPPLEHNQADSAGSGDCVHTVTQIVLLSPFCEYVQRTEAVAVRNR